MAVEKSYARLGFFLVVALVVVLATALLFIQRFRRQAVIEVVTYIPEDVSGLDVSSPVRYRGVSVGRVTEVRVDPRETTIEVDFELFLDRLHTIGANVERIRRIADIGGVMPRLRARVVGNPVTGEAYLLLDVPKNPPPPIALGFKPERPYIASMPSSLATVQNRLPEVLERAEVTLRTLTDIVTRIPGSLDRSDRFFTNVERIIQNSDLPALRRLGAQHGFEVIDVNEWVQSHDVATVRWTAATSTPRRTARMPRRRTRDRPVGAYAPVPCARRA